MHILVTGGAGYIGSHTCLELLRQGHRVTVLDNFSNSSPESLGRVRELAGGTLDFFEVDLLETAQLNKIFARLDRVDAVIHFAGFKAVGESVSNPLKYYRNNVLSTVNLCAAMAGHGCCNIVFSSSATVYGDPQQVPLREDSPLFAVNPYGRTKLICEDLLRDLHQADPSWNVALLRYFNPVGADPSGRIGEDPLGEPDNLMPYIAQVAVGRRPELRVFGNDYPTPDGTCIRDYIHVSDLARGHVHAIDRLMENPGVVVYNLGTGRGHSVLEVVAAFSRAAGREIPHRIVGRRPGDAAVCYADPSLARQELGWKAEMDLDAMCRDAWRWQSANPRGYAPAERETAAIYGEGDGDQGSGRGSGGGSAVPGA